MLARLRHDRLVGGHDQYHKVDSTYSGQHVLHELFMAGHVHETDLYIAEIQVSKPEINSNAPGLLLFQAIGISPGQCHHERAFSMVDMPGRSCNDVAHTESVKCQVSCVKSQLEKGQAPL